MATTPRQAFERLLELERSGELADFSRREGIDLLDLGRAGPVAQEQALVGTVPLYEREPGTLAAIRDRAKVLRMDTEWLRRLDLDLMAST